MPRSSIQSTKRPAAKPQRSRNKILSMAAASKAAVIKSSEPGSSESKSGSNRAVRAAERRQAIVAAALDEFIARGFAAARLDDIAKQAGVAKGTIYLHFKDKEALFLELVRIALAPPMEQLTAPPVAGRSARAVLETFVETMVHELEQTPRGDIVRLIMAEGPRFPALADSYYQLVAEPAIAALGKLIEYGAARGEIRNEVLIRFPHLVIAPLLLTLIWQGLFRRHAPLDSMAMLNVHLDLIFGEPRPN